MADLLAAVSQSLNILAALVTVVIILALVPVAVLGVRRG